MKRSSTTDPGKHVLREGMTPCIPCRADVISTGYPYIGKIRILPRKEMGYIVN